MCCDSVRGYTSHVIGPFFMNTGPSPLCDCEGKICVNACRVCNRGNEGRESLGGVGDGCEGLGPR